MMERSLWDDLSGAISQALASSSLRSSAAFTHSALASTRLIAKRMKRETERRRNRDDV
jgi:hypothetical protein